MTQENRELRLHLKKGDYTAIPHCKDVCITSLYGVKNFEIEFKDRYLTIYVDMTKPLRSSDVSCRMDAEYLERNIESFQKLEIRDEYIAKRLKNWASSWTEDYDQVLLSVKLSKEYRFSCQGSLGKHRIEFTSLALI